MSLYELQNELEVVKAHYRDAVNVILAKYADIIVGGTKVGEEPPAVMLDWGGNKEEARDRVQAKRASRKPGAPKKARATKVELADLDGQVMAFAKDDDAEGDSPFSKGSAAKALRRSPAEVGTALRRLVKAGALLTTGNRGSTRYYLPPSPMKANGVAAEASAS